VGILQPMKLDLYSKPACSLCEKMKAVIERVRGQVPFELQEHDIRLSPMRYAELRFDIPVLFINGQRAVHHRVEEADLLALLSEAERRELRGTAVAQTGGQGEQLRAPPQEESGDT
jgi:glutaredoxin